MQVSKSFHCHKHTACVSRHNEALLSNFMRAFGEGGFWILQFKQEVVGYELEITSGCADLEGECMPIVSHHLTFRDNLKVQ